MRHTRSIATEGLPPHDREARVAGVQSEQVTGSLERVSPGSAEQQERIARVRDAAFPIALRGYEREAVDAYVKLVDRLITDLEASRSPEAAIRRALDQVGEETSSILQRAQATANEITERSRASADDRVREAERESAALTEGAEDRVRELEADYGEIWSRRDHLLDEVRDLAERLLATADDASERFPTQADEVAAASPGVDTDSFPELTAGPEDTTVRSFTGEADPDLEPEAGDETMPMGSEPASGERVRGEGAGEPAIGDELSSGDEMDFADSPGDEVERDFDERPPREPGPA